MGYSHEISEIGDAKGLSRMKSYRTTLRINATATRIISGAIIAVGVSMLITNTVMTTPFIMGIALSILGAAIIVLAQRNPLKTVTEKLTN